MHLTDASNPELTRIDDSAPEVGKALGDETASDFEMAAPLDAALLPSDVSGFTTAWTRNAKDDRQREAV